MEKYEEIIADDKYTKIAVLDHKSIKEFIVNEVSENQGWASVVNMYQVVGVFAFILGLFRAFMPFYLTRDAVALFWLGGGLLFSVTLLIVLHELIHAVAYKLIGAEHLSFGMNLRKFIFYVQSDKSVLNYKQFKIVALAPAVSVAVLSIVGMIVFYNQPPFYFFLSVVCVHGFFCSGDFGMLCFFQNRPDLDVVTFDVKDEGKTYFYAKSEIQ